MLGFLSKVFGSKNERTLGVYQKIVDQINALEPSFAALSDDQLRLKTREFKARVEQGTTLGFILPEAFAAVREASKRALNMRHFDVQLIGGIAMHKGNIAEMKTGEGKTLVSTLPAYLNALSGNPVMIVSVNDYLVKRDSEWMGKIYNFLDMSVGCIHAGIPHHTRQEQYLCDIIYIENKELGFDYLRDNMRTDGEFNILPRQDKEITRDGMYFAIIDEIDSILIDEARTPLIISGAVEQDEEIYSKINAVIKDFQESVTSKEKDSLYTIDEKTRQIHLTDAGYEDIERIVAQYGLINTNESLYGLSSNQQNIHSHEVLDPERQIYKSKLIHHIDQSLKANLIFKENVDYIVRNKKILIIDEFTGRVMDGRRYSEGLHQALEAKHGLEVEEESQTLASITYQNLFRMFKKLAGMTGTANTEATEFEQIYNLEVVTIPTNMTIKRVDHEDEVYRTEKEKLDAILTLVKKTHATGQPILIGTTNIQKSEVLSNLFRQNNIEHEVLNAKQHEREAQIIAQAGAKNAVTIATNMAGRGTDIVLGGNLENMLKRAVEAFKKSHKTFTEEDIQSIEKTTKEAWQKANQEVKDLGGLFVIGSERHESRRIDDQLRGRSGRQGDNGHSIFFLSLEDDLLRIFAGDTLKTLLARLGFKEGESLKHSMLTSMIQRAQRKVEAYNYDVRKNLIKYDDVMNDQRKVIYKKRFDIITNKIDHHKDIMNMTHDKLERMIASVFNTSGFTTESLESFYTIAQAEFNIAREDLPQVDDLETLKDKMTALLNSKIQAVDAVILANAKAQIAQLKKEIENKANDLERFKTPEGVFANTPEGISAFELSIVRGLYKNTLLNALDTCWRNQLYFADHIKSTIGLKAYAQKDPFGEYRLEVFEMFEGMFKQFEDIAVKRIFKIPT